MGGPSLNICENGGADQLRGNCEADRRLCFRYTDNTTHLISESKFKASGLLLWLRGPFVLDLFGNHIVGSLSSRLI